MNLLFHHTFIKSNFQLQELQYLCNSKVEFSRNHYLKRKTVKGGGNSCAKKNKQNIQELEKKPEIPVQDEIVVEVVQIDGDLKDEQIEIKQIEIQQVDVQQADQQADQQAVVQENNPIQQVVIAEGNDLNPNENESENLIGQKIQENEKQHQQLKNTFNKAKSYGCQKLSEKKVEFGIFGQVLLTQKLQGVQELEIKIKNLWHLVIGISPDIVSQWTTEFTKQGGYGLSCASGFVHFQGKQQEQFPIYKLPGEKIKAGDCIKVQYDSQNRILKYIIQDQVLTLNVEPNTYHFAVRGGACSCKIMSAEKIG